MASKKTGIEIKKLSRTSSKIKIEDLDRYLSPHFTEKEKKEALYKHYKTNCTGKTLLLSAPQTLNLKECKKFYSQYSESVCAAPLEDLVEFNKWNSLKKRYPFNSPYMPLDISAKPKTPLPANSSLENIGCLIMGWIIETQTKHPHKPIARPVGKSPDLISLNTSTRQFCFSEAKCTTNKTIEIKPLIRDGILNLASKTCHVYQLIITKVTTLDPVEVEVDIYDLRHQTSKPINYSVILNSLEEQLITRAIGLQDTVKDSLNDIFGPDIYEEIKGNSEQDLTALEKKIEEEVPRDLQQKLRKKDKVLSEATI